MEVGALDGETRSNTLELERKLGWSGLLIEGDTNSQKVLVAKNRKAWIVKNCISTRNHTIVVNFAHDGNIGAITYIKPEVEAIDATGSNPDVLCFPLYSMLRALNRTSVDFFSLDVEGFELEVLMTIPFEEIDIKVSITKIVLKEEGLPACILGLLLF